MKNIKKNISVVAIVTVILISSLSVSAYSTWGTRIRDDSLLRMVYSDYCIAYCRDKDLPWLNAFYTNLLSVSLAKDCVPTKEDFPELEGIVEINLSSALVDGVSDNEANIAVIEFETDEQCLTAYYELSQGENSVIGDAVALSYKMMVGESEPLISKVMFWTRYEFSGGIIPAPVYGDVNCDSKVSVSDVVYCAKYISKKTQGFDTLVGKYQADCNQDGKIDGEDLLYMIKTMTVAIN